MQYCALTLKKSIMKKVIFLLMAILCLSGSSAWAQKNGYPYIKGEGDVVKEEFVLSSFEGIDLNVCGDVVLTPGSSQKVIVEGQKNILDNIQREIQHGVWQISFIKSVTDAKMIKIYITVPTIHHIGIGGCGDLRTTAPFTGIQDLDLTLTGSGDLDMQAEAVSTTMRLSGSGDIEMSGQTKSLEIKMVGSGDVVAKDLVSSKCKVEISGSGDAVVNASEELNVMITGSGNVRYKGGASVTAKVVGSGDVSKL